MKHKSKVFVSPIFPYVIYLSYQLLPFICYGFPTSLLKKEVSDACIIPHIIGPNFDRTHAI